MKIVKSYDTIFYFLVNVEGLIVEVAPGGLCR